MGGLFLAWAAEVGVITWRDLTGKSPGHTVKGLPIPADYLATFLVFGVLGFVPKDNVGASRAATLTGWAFVIATLLNVAPTVINPTNPKAVSSTATPASSTITQGGTS